MSLNPASERADFLSLLPRLTSFSEQGVSAPMGQGPDGPQVVFRDLPDPKARYATLKGNPTFQRYEMVIPPIFKANGNLVVPGAYEDVIPDGTLVAVRGKLKMWAFILLASRSFCSSRRCRYDIVSRDRACTNRPYLFVFDRIQVVDGAMEGWDNNSSSSVLGKRRFEVFSLFFLLLLPSVLILL